MEDYSIITIRKQKKFIPATRQTHAKHSNTHAKHTRVCLLYTDTEKERTAHTSTTSDTISLGKATASSTAEHALYTSAGSQPSSCRP